MPIATFWFFGQGKGILGEVKETLQIFKYLSNYVMTQAYEKSLGQKISLSGGRASMIKHYTKLLYFLDMGFIILPTRFRVDIRANDAIASVVDHTY